MTQRLVLIRRLIRVAGREQTRDVAVDTGLEVALAGDAGDRLLGIVTQVGDLLVHWHAWNRWRVGTLWIDSFWEFFYRV